MEQLSIFQIANFIVKKKPNKCCCYRLPKDKKAARASTGLHPGGMEVTLLQSEDVWQSPNK